MEAHGVFYAKDDGGVIRLTPPEAVILSCYRLARFYQVDPRIFLNKSLSDLARDIMWTSKLSAEIRAEQEAAESPQR